MRHPWDEVLDQVEAAVPQRKRGRQRAFVDEFDLRDACPNLFSADVEAAVEVLVLSGRVAWADGHGLWRPT